MSQYWLETTSPENFEIDRKRNFSVAGFTKRFRKLVNQVGRGDRVVVYIIRLKRFGAALEVIAAPYYDAHTRIWIEEDQIWPCRFATKPIVELAEDEFLDVQRVLPSLTFVSDPQKATSYALAFRQSLRRIPREDYELIESEMRKVIEQPTLGRSKRSQQDARNRIMDLDLASKSLHDRLGEMLQIIGSRMGYNSVARHKITPQHAMELDVAWLKAKNPEVAFEVQIGGDIYAAKERLAQAKEFNYRKLIVVIKEEQLPRLNEVLKFGQLVHWVDAWSIQAVLELYESGTAFLNLYERLLDSRYKERAEVGFE